MISSTPVSYEEMIEALKPVYNPDVKRVFTLKKNRSGEVTSIIVSVDNTKGVVGFDDTKRKTNKKVATPVKKSKRSVQFNVF